MSQAKPAGRRGGSPPLRYFEAKNRSRTTEYQCPAMSSALPAIESVINSIVSVLPCVGSRTTRLYLGSSGLNFKERVTPRQSRIRMGITPRRGRFAAMSGRTRVSRAGSAASGNRSSERRCTQLEHDSCPATGRRSLGNARYAIQILRFGEQALIAASLLLQRLDLIQQSIHARRQCPIGPWGR